MEITKDDIKVRRIIGKTANGYPVFHILTKGGFNIIMRKLPDNGEWQVLGKGHPFAVARHIAEQVEKNIQWDESLNKTEDFNENLEKSQKSDPQSTYENHYKLASHHSKRAGKALNDALLVKEDLDDFNKHIFVPHLEKEHKARANGIQFEHMPHSYQLARQLLNAISVGLQNKERAARLKNHEHSDIALQHFQASGLTPKQAHEEHQKHSSLHHELESDKAPFDENLLRLAWQRKNPKESFPTGL